MKSKLKIRMPGVPSKRTAKFGSDEQPAEHDKTNQQQVTPAVLVDASYITTTMSM
jgi:hypothetical protein